MRGKKRSDDEKSAVLGAFAAGLAINEIARLYKIDKSIVSRWCSKLDQSELQQVATNRNINLKQKIVDVAIAILTNVERIAQETSKEEYIRTQSASGLAELADTLFNQATRIFEAAEPESNGNPASELEAKVIPGANNTGGS